MATFDKDGDGTVLDDFGRLGAQGLGAAMGVGGAGLGMFGTAVGAAGGLMGAGIGAVGTALLGAGLSAEVIPGLQIPATAAALLGGTMMLGGAGLAGGSLLAGAGMGVGGLALGAAGVGMGTVGADVGEIGGDFLARQLFGPTMAPGTPAGPPSLSDVLPID